MSSAPPQYESTSMVIHCDYRSTGLAHKLSNLCNYPFVLDGIHCESFEGFLQSLKFRDAVDASAVRKLYGTKCFFAGQKGNGWKISQVLWWNGVGYQRSSKEYANLLERAYDALFDQNEDFCDALFASRFYELRHDFGKCDMMDSVLTRTEYIYNLYRLRSRFKR